VRSANARRPGPGAISLALLGAAAFLAAGTALAVHQVEHDLTDTATTALDEAGIDLRVSYRGRDAELTGTPADPRQATEAVHIVTAVPGTRQVRTGWGPTSDGVTTDSPDGDSPESSDPTETNTPSAYPGFPQGRVSFDSAQTVLDDESTAYLDRVIVFLQDNPSVHLQVQGHADESGSEDTNVALSWNRAHEVVRYLIAHEISMSRLSAQGLGSTVPLTTNDTPEGRAANRRVELTIEESP
jgi:outer membrane protein OmpA-like peptidoglycan-associated protein